jgi:hypothetical protein
MSLYDDKKEKVRLAVIKACKKGIQDNFHQLGMWLSFEDWEFPRIYESEFNKEFSQYISQDENTNTHITYAGKNLTYFVSTITSITKDIKKINKMVDEFITTQFEDFENACDYISMTMYDESNPDTDETSVPVGINPSGDDNPSNT